MRSGALLLATVMVALGSLIAVACGEDNLGIVVPGLPDASFVDGASSSGGSSGGSSGASSGDAASGPTHTVGGAVSGLAASKTVVLTLGTNNDVSVTANASFTFPTGVAPGAAYAVTVKTQPNLQKCVVSNGSGTMSTTNVTNVVVSCVDTCGDGIVDTASGEGCDDDNTNNVDACSNVCAKNPVWIGGNEATFIENALAQIPEPFTAVPAGASSYGAAPASGVFISSNDNDDLTFPTNWQTFLDAGGNILVIGGSNTASYRTFIGGFLAVDATANWHMSDDCTSDWNKIGTHPSTTLLPATYEFPSQASSFHMLHFSAAGQPAGTVLLGETCHAAGNDAIYAMRTYPSGGTFAYLAYDLGKFVGTGTTPSFTIPFLQSYLAHVRSKK